MEPIVLLMATRQTPGLDNATFALQKFGWSYEILGLGQPWGGWQHRMRCYAEGCERQQADQLIILMDAYDAFAIQASSGFQERYLSFGKEVVVGAESNRFAVFVSNLLMSNHVDLTDWWLDPSGGGCFSKSEIPRSRWVNGGTVCGRADRLSKMYRWMLSSQCADDQAGIARYMLQHPRFFMVDSDSRLFRNVSVGKPKDLGHAYFAHFPGLEFFNFGAYNRAARRYLGRYHQPLASVYEPYYLVAVIASIVVLASAVAAYRFYHKT